MPDLVARSVNGVSIRLTDERWAHIQDGHSEITHPQEVLDVIETPELTADGEEGALICASRRGVYWLVVVYREVSSWDGFVITAHLARRLSKKISSA